MDFGKHPRMRVLVQDYFVALNQHVDGNHLIQAFIFRYEKFNVFQCEKTHSVFLILIYSVHGRTMICPHPRVINNLVAACLASIFSLFEFKQLDSVNNHLFGKNLKTLDDQEWEIHTNCFINIFNIM